jgi:hypothetical protein
MNEWIDFAVYAIQLIVCLLVAARCAAHFKAAVVADRNPDWAAAHPQSIAKVESSSRWNLLVQAWTVFSVLVLLAYRLDLEPLALKAPGVPTWRTLLQTAYLLLGVGFVLFGLGAVSFRRWLTTNVPLGEQRSASLTPRSLETFVPRGLKFAVYGSLFTSVVARPVASLYYPDRIANVQGGFVFSLATAFMLVLAVGISVKRRPNVFDRVVGSSYRMRVVRACFVLMAFTALGELLLLWTEIAHVDGSRLMGVVFSAFTTVVLASLMPFPPRNHDAATPLHAA